MDKFKAVVFAGVVGISLLLFFPAFNNIYRQSEIYGNLVNGTGTATGSPISLKSGTNTITVTGSGSFQVNLTSGYASANSGTRTVVGAPVSLIQGNNTINVIGAGSGTITITVDGIAPLTGSGIKFLPYVLIIGAIYAMIVIIRTRQSP